MKKILFVLGLVCTFAAVSIAQTTDTKPTPTEQVGKGKHRGKGKHQRPNMKKTLGLTDEQDSKIKGFQDSYKGRVKAIRSDKSLSQDQKKAQMKDLMAQHETDMKATLTPEQYTKWTEAKNKRTDKMKNNRKQRPRKDNN